MRAKLLTLRFSPQLGRFDDAALIALQQKVVLEHMREHLVQIGGEAMLVCVAVWRERTEPLASYCRAWRYLSPTARCAPRPNSRPTSPLAGRGIRADRGIRASAA